MHFHSDSLYIRNQIQNMGKQERSKNVQIELKLIYLDLLFFSAIYEYDIILSDNFLLRSVRSL